MKINESQPIQRINPYSQQSGMAREIAKPAKQATKSDEVSISEEALHLAQAPDTDQTVNQGYLQERINRINQIKQSIQDGTYQVDNRVVARKIYDSFTKHS